MRWLTLLVDGRSRPGALADDGSVVDLVDAARIQGQTAPIDLLDVIRAWPEERERLEQIIATASGSARRSRASVTAAAPLERPGKILCLAGNYREHIVESGFAAVGERDIVTPQMFLKPATCLIGDGAAVRLAAANVRVGWEVELAVVVGRRAREVDAAQAMQHVFGYTILNDLSERGLNSGIPGRKVRERDPFFDWLAGKWFDGFAPCGPWIVTADEIPDPHRLDLRLSVNGEVRQQGSTADMIFNIPSLIAAASAIMTLEPGDIIATGTPAGAGIGSGDSFLSPGDQILCEIDGIGALHTTIGGTA
jgi:2-keto-4-pentenoate hydratase/2-oxohepta-3-ene-1,7-dioic acid hydratase in catechol pathway